MIITKIELQNITTHVKSTIDFHEGVNILTGTNGAGKSTVVKMIGFILFDHLDQTQNDYVRKAAVVNGPSLVKVWCIGKDKQEYIIERGIGKTSNKLEIIHAQTGNIVRKINKVEEYQKWLKEQMNLSQDLDIRTIFENAVGVAQGTFTAPFMMTPANRKKVFGPLINVEVYERIFKRFLEILHEFEEELRQMDLQKQKLEGELEQKVSLLAEKETFEKNIEKISAEVAIKSKELDEINSKFQIQKNLKDQLDQCKRSYEKLKLQVLNFQTMLAAKQKAVTEAKDAKKICLQTQSDFQRYNELTKDEKDLRGKNDELTQLKQQESTLKQTIARLESQMIEFDKQINQIKTLAQQLPALESAYKTSEVLSSEITQLKNELAKIQVIEKNLGQYSTELRQNQQKIQSFQNQIQAIPGLRDSIKNLESLESMLSSAQSALSVANSELKQLKKDKENVKGGKCPFLHEQCKNIKESSLENYFNGLIQEKQKEISELVSDLESKSQQVAELKKNADLLQNYEKAEIQAKAYQDRIDMLTEQIKSAQNALKSKGDFEKQLSGKQAEIDRLDGDVRLFHSYSQKVRKDLPGLELEKQKALENLTIQKKRLDPISVRIDELKEVPENLRNIKLQLEQLRDAHDKYQSNFQSMQKLPALEQELTNTQNELDRTSAEFETQQKNRDLLLTQFSDTQFQTLEKQKNDLQIHVAQLEQELKKDTEYLQNTVHKLNKLGEREAVLGEIRQNYKDLQEVFQFSKVLRDLYKEAGPKITKVLLASINKKATTLFQELIGESAVELIWDEDYNVIIKTAQNSRPFNLLSGGEQMAAALAIRLAILRTLSNIDFAFFDEPTTNLDAEKRRNLAQCIKKIPGFSQLFVISHDDTFESMGDFVIRIEKDAAEQSKISYITTQGQIISDVNVSTGLS
jgi:exonuclease SbcC